MGINRSFKQGFEKIALKDTREDQDASVPEVKELEKKALIGPMVDIGTLGMPSMLGYQLGKNLGMSTEADVLDEDEPGRLKKLLAYGLIPGYTGYRMGLGTGREVKGKAERKREEAVQSLGEEKNAGLRSVATGVSKLRGRFRPTKSRARKKRK